MDDVTVPARLEARNLTASLPGDGGPVRVFAGVSLHVAGGEIVDIAGPSGGGKTTLLRALARLLPDAGGAMLLDGEPSAAISAQRWRSLVALLPQKPAIAPADLATNLTLPWQLKVERVSPRPTASDLEEALAEVGLDSIPLDRDALRLSVGQQARVALLRVLLTKPLVLLLDEPDAALDPESADALALALTRVAATGTGILRVRHRTSDGLAARRLVLDSGVLTEVQP
ncbi:MAG: ATP-binding cassette domain-containing protein [Coriobacteriia bacterium]|nr:ATP-binding cassette domain-containing protein [Coriobacteriia bacterium]